MSAGEARFGGKTCVLHGKEDLRVESHPKPSAPKGEVVVQVQRVGICGSDLAYYYKCEIAGRKIEFPAAHQMRFAGVMGHEASGVVVAVGEGVTSVEVGDRVAMEPGVPCGQCKLCFGGRYNLCKSLVFLGSFLNDNSGALCEYMVHPARFCFKLPDHVSYEEAALMEPLAVALQAIKRGRVGMGDKVLVAGAGPVGILVMMGALAVGVSSVSITDISPTRLAFAKSHGATTTYNVAKERVEEEFDVCIECSGAESSVQMCITQATRGGRVVLVGTGVMAAELRGAQLKELDVMGVFRYCGVYQSALEYIASGRVSVKDMVSHRFKLDEANAAFHAAREDPSAIKVMICPSE